MAATVAGVVAVVALFTLPLWLRYLAHGNEAPLAIALMLWAVERHLDGRRDHTLVLLFAACLLRPEVFPFMAGVAVLLWRAEPARRPLIAGLLAALPLLWLVPEWIGSGNPLDAGKQAASEPWWSLSNAEVPWLAALERAHSLAGLPLELAALAGVVAAALRRERATLVLAGIGIAWLLLILVMTQLGFSGANRYFLAPLVVTCLLAGVGVGAAIGAPARCRRGRPSPRRSSRCSFRSASTAPSCSMGRSEAWMRWCVSRSASGPGSRSAAGRRHSCGAPWRRWSRGRPAPHRRGRAPLRTQARRPCKTLVKVHGPVTPSASLRRPMTTILAYLDPGSGSMILQIIAGGLAAVAVTAKLYWGRLLTFLRIRKPEDEAANQQPDSA